MIDLVRSTVGKHIAVLQLAWFTCFAGLISAAIVNHPAAFWSEPAIDVNAAAAWVSGNNPWAAEWNGIRFAGPPTMLLPYTPLVAIGPEASRWLVGGICLLAAIAAIRMSRIPWWWLAWPPLFYAVIHASFDSVIPALIVGGVGGLAAFVKPYVAVVVSPRQLAVLFVLLLVTFPFLPWSGFLHELGTIQDSFRTQSLALSVFGQPLVMIAVAVAAWRVGPDARWLIVPALWPLAQFQYGAMTLPFVARRPLLAMGLAVPLPGAAAATLIAWGLLSTVQQAREHQRRQAPGRRFLPDIGVARGPSVEPEQRDGLRPDSAEPP